MRTQAIPNGVGNLITCGLRSPLCTPQQNLLLAESGDVDPVHPATLPVGTVASLQRPDLLLQIFRTGFSSQALSARYIKAPIRGLLCIWRRERDSNPRRASNPYSLSRGALSTAQPSLLLTRREQLCTSFSPTTKNQSAPAAFFHSVAAGGWGSRIIT